MVKTYRTVKQEAIQKYRDYRNIYNLVCSEKFELAYGKANQQIIDFWIATGDLESLKNWVNENSEKETLASLKEKARAIGIKNWSRLDKFALITALENYESRKVDRAVRASESVSP